MVFKVVLITDLDNKTASKLIANEIRWYRQTSTHSQASLLPMKYVGIDKHPHIRKSG